MSRRTANRLPRPHSTPHPRVRRRPPSTQVAEIERVIGCGQVEQLIEQAKGELVLIPEYASWKMWEVKPASPEDEDFADFYEDLEYGE